MASKQDSKRALSLPLVPRKPGIPVIGNIEFAGDKKEFLNACSGSMTRICLLGKSIVIIHDHYLMQKMFRLEGSHVRGGAGLSSIIPLFGAESIAAIHGKSHKKTRGILIPCFRPSDLLKTTRQIQAIASRRFASMAEQGPCDAVSLIEETAFELAMTFIGFNYESLSRSGSKPILAVHQFVSALASFPVNLGKRSKYGRGLKAANKLRSLAREEISSRKQWNECDESTDDDGDSDAKPRNAMMEDDLLQRMLNAFDDSGSSLSEQALVDTMVTLLVASFDTTCASMTALMLNMCRFPDVQEKVHAYIRDMLGPDSDEYNGKVPISEEKWRDLEYMDQLILETQRFDPPLATSGSRVATKDFELEGYRIKKNTVLLTNVISNSRSTKLWKDPNTFNPDRFDKSLPGYKSKVAALNTFGGGSRACIGKGFAMIEMKVYATLLLRDYKLEFADPTSVPNVTYPLAFALDRPLRVKLTRRQKK